MTKDNKDLFVCSCHSTEHQMVVFREHDDEEFPMLYVHINLNKRPFWERVNYGLKYIFGRQCRYGAFDEFIFNHDDLPKLKNIVKHLKQLKKRK
jgi:hypothetical protein